MVERESQEYVDQLFIEKNLIQKESLQWYEEKIREYEIIFRNMEANKRS